MTDRRGLVLEPERSLAWVGESMNFLNEIANRHPTAVSLAAGRPAREHLGLGALDPTLQRFVDALRERGGSEESVWQYGPTAGLIQGLIAESLGHDEHIEVDPGTVLVTAGAQEGMSLVMTLFERARDVLLVPDPTYVGITGAAAVAGVSVSPLPAKELDAAAVHERARALGDLGLRARALYLVPDFSNPLGDTMSADRRARLIDAACELDLWIIEDSPYRIFAFDQAPPPSLLASTREGRVIHLGTFAKALCPGLRIGYLVWPSAPADRWRSLITAKSFMTLNTSPLTQALAEGALRLRGVPSLGSAAAEARSGYRERRDALLAAMDELLGDLPGVSWEVPGGGFFLTVHLPFEFGVEDMQRCAEEHEVLVCPMSIFSPTGSWRRAIRLSYSYVPPEALREGVRRLSAYLGERCG
ncbi:MAG: PLP-dependent aminotransferase family protein [Enhygromyxa sp.]